MGHLKAGRWGEAIVLLRGAVAREPGRLAAARGLASAYLQVKDEEGARGVLRELTMQMPMCAEGWRLAAQLEWKLGQYDAAMKILGTGLELLPHSEVLNRQKSLFWGARGKEESNPRNEFRGLSGMREGSGTRVERDSDFLDRLAQDMRLLETVLNSPGEGDLGMLTELEFKLARMLENQPYHADRQLGLAKLQVKIGSIGAAMLSVQRALAGNANYVEALRLKATILGKMGEVDAAIGVLEGLIRRGMDWADLHYQVAELENLRGKKSEARSHLYSAIRVNPKFERAKEMLERCAA